MKRIEIHEKLQELVGEQLDEIKIGWQHVQLCFLRTSEDIISKDAFVSLHEDFAFCIQGSRKRKFCIDHRERNASNSSADFGLLQGAICEAIELNDAKFRIYFEGAGEIILELGKDAFECFEVLFAGIKKNELEFLGVV